MVLDVTDGNNNSVLTEWFIFRMIKTVESRNNQVLPLSIAGKIR